MKDIHYIMCSGSRSGTHYAGYLLKAFYLGHPCQMHVKDMNHLDAIPSGEGSLEQWGNIFFQDQRIRTGDTIYSRWVASDQFENVMHSLREKADASCVFDVNLLEHIYPDIKFLYLRREDYVKQAISMVKADQTKQWLSSRLNVDQAPEYNFTQIVYWTIRFVRSRSLWKRFFVRYGIEPLDVVYEDFCKAPREWLLRIKEHLGIHNDVPITEEAIQMHMEDEKAPQKMSDHINTKWERKFYRDLERLKENPLPVDNEEKK